MLSFAQIPGSVPWGLLGLGAMDMALSAENKIERTSTVTVPFWTQAQPCPVCFPRGAAPELFLSGLLLKQQMGKLN